MSEETTERVHEYPAAVIRPLRSAELRALALERQVFDEASLEKYDPYFFSAEISNGRLDSHSTRMAQSTLKNFAAEAEAGVSFLYSHDITELIGRSMGGQFVGGQGNGVARVVADFYITPGLKLGNVESDQIIRAIDSNTLRDVSAGFYGGEWVCSICGNDVWDWQNCRHYPGCKSEVQADGRTENVVCTADVENAHLAEESGVYKGSTPGAMIAKATRQAQEGTLEPKARLYLERHLRLHLPDKRVTVPGHSEEKSMPEKREVAENPSGDDTSQGAPPPAQELPTSGAPPADPPADTQPEAEVERRVVAFTRTHFASVGLKAEDAPANMRALASLAADGKRYRDDLIAYTLSLGTRAYGDKLNRDMQEGILKRMSIEEIRSQAALWGAKGDEIFPGGRQTVDEAEEPDAKQPQKRATHHGAYQT